MTHCPTLTKWFLYHTHGVGTLSVEAAVVHAHSYLASAQKQSSLRWFSTRCVICGQKFEIVENEENLNFVISLSKKFQIWIQHIQFCKIWFQAGFVSFNFSVSEQFCA